MRRLLAAALVLTMALATGCTTGADDDDPGDGGETTSPSPAPSEPEPEGQGPVAGAGAQVSPEDLEAWCGAVTPDQLSALTGYEIEEVLATGARLDDCMAEPSGVELDLVWGSQPSSKSIDEYEALWSRPAGAYEVSRVALDSGTEVVLASQAAARTVRAGTIFEGRRIEVLVMALEADESVTLDDLGAMATQLVSVYVD